MSDWQIITGDCLEILPTIPAGSIDAVITDPPYGVDFRGAEWDRSIPVWLESARRIAPTVIFTTGPTTIWDYPRPDWVNCVYREAANSRSITGGFNHWTPILIYGPAKFPVDSIKLHAIAHAAPLDIGHPSPKPIALMRWLIRHSTQPGDLILDPFTGSGSTGVAAILEGRRFIGIELDPAYAEIARRRCRDAAAQPPLFTEAPAPVPPAEQPALLGIAP